MQSIRSDFFRFSGDLHDLAVHPGQVQGEVVGL